MGVAIGSRSTISFAEEVDYKTPPGGVYRAINFNNESLGENINTIVSEAIDPRRIVPSVRGGNISSDGSMSSELYIDWIGTWLKHLLTCVPDTVTEVPKDLATSLVVSRGDYVRHDDGTTTRIYLVVNSGGTITDPAPELIHEFGFESIDGIDFEYAAEETSSTGVTIDDTSDEIEDIGHGLSDGHVVYFAADVLPTGLSSFTGYYINSSLATGVDRYTLHTTKEDALTATNPVTFSDTGTSVRVYRGQFFKHTFTGDIQKPCGGLSIEKAIYAEDFDCNPETYYWMFNGSRLNTLALNIPQEGIIMADWGILATRVDEYTGTSRATSIENNTEDSIVGYQTYINVDGKDSTVMSSATINFTNNYDESIFVIGDRYRHDLPEGRREITGSFDLYFENKEMYEIFKEEKTVAMLVDIYHLGNFFRIDIPQAKFTGGTPTPVIGGNGVISSSFEMSAFLRDYDSPGYDVRIILKNQTPSY